MKKNLMSISALSLMLLAVATSCAKNEINQDSPVNVDPSLISFRASTGLTKANDHTLSTMQKGGFHVIGLAKDGDYLPGFTAPAADNFVLFGFDQGWDWTVAAEAEKKKWPTLETDYPVSFFAAYPTTLDITRTTVTKNLTQLSNITTGQDPFNTYYEGVKNTFEPAVLTIDELAAYSLVSKMPASGRADFTFKHIMSNMAFKIQVPKGYKAYVQSVKIANVATTGSYDYSVNSIWTPTAYDVAGATNHAHYAHYDGVGQALESVAPDSLTSFAINGLPDGNGGFNTLKLVPQISAPAWMLGDKTTPAANTFRADAKKWSDAKLGKGITKEDIDRWHKTEPAGNGMKMSGGWKGARIELTYALVDDKGATLVGKVAGVGGEKVNRYVRVGFPLDLSLIGADANGQNGKGFEAKKRYTFSIPLGTENATGGVLLDPDYKDANGGSTEEGVDNPKINPGEPVVDPSRPINFNLSVDGWEDASGTLTEMTF